MLDFRRQNEEHSHLNIIAEVVSSFKFLGLFITEHLTWTNNSMAVDKKFQERLCFLMTLRTTNLAMELLISF